MSLSATLPPVETPEQPATEAPPEAAAEARSVADVKQETGEHVEPEDFFTPADGEAATEPAPAEEEKPGSAGPAAETPDVQTWHAIQEAREEERDAESDVDELAEDLKAAKKRLEAASLRLGKLIDEAKFPNLFNQRKPESTGETPVSEVPAEDDAWRAVTLEQLGITKPRLVKALTEREPPLDTLGALADWTKLKGDFWAADIDGVGPAGRQEIEDAVAEYWVLHPRDAAPAPETSGDGKTEPFDDDAIDQDSIDLIIEITGLLVIEVARRAGGRWACGRYAHLGGNRELLNTGPAGHYPDRVAAVVAAADQVHEFIRGQGDLTGNAKRRAGEVLKALDALDKKLKAEGPAAARAVAEPGEAQS